ncbi:MAG: Crp/Fnr family transcriptional regulator [Chloroflexi bacterium]|nr:Crp/Fnr family transcriptional regulator [Chloroflexota bacterium]
MLYNLSMPLTGSELQDISHLESNDLLYGLEPSELASIAQAGRVRRLKTGAYLFRQGAPATNLYILVAGSVKMTQLTPEGHQVLLRVASPGETIGAIATVGNARYPATAQAAEECRLLAWDSDSLLSLMERFPHLAINALRFMSRHVQEFQDRYRELATERVERRVARALLRLAGQAGRKVDGGILIDLALTRQDLAEMTGTTRYTVSRMLSEWEEQGVIEAGRKQVIIKRPHSLVVIAEDLPPAISPDTPETH